MSNMNRWAGVRWYQMRNGNWLVLQEDRTTGEILDEWVGDTLLEALIIAVHDICADMDPPKAFP